MDLVLVASLIVSLALFLMFAGAVMLMRARPREIAGRFERLPVTRVPVGAVTAAGPRRARPGRLARLLAAGSAPDLATDLARTDLKLAPAEFRMINFASTAIGLALGLLIFRQTLILAPLGGLLGFLSPRWYLHYLQGKRLNAFDKQLPDTVTLLANSLRTGFSLLQSMETASRELQPPVSAEFARVVREVGLGLTLPEALANMVDRVPSDDLDFMITAIDIQYEVGGNLAEVLDNIASTIRARVGILREVHVLTTQQRYSALVLSLLPLVVGGTLFAMNPSYMSVMWQTTCGIQMLGAGVVLIIIGYVVVQRVAKIEV